MGHILCRTCKLKLCLGKLRRDESHQPASFAYNDTTCITSHDLGAVALHFLAVHLKHDRIVAGDDVILEMDLQEYDSLNIEVGQGEIRLERQPCEPPKDRKLRLKTGWVHAADTDENR